MQNAAGNRALAARYARALFEVAIEGADPRAIERDLAGFVALLTGHPALGRALLSPAIPAPRKVAVVSELVDRGAYRPPLPKLLTLIAERDHLGLLPQVLKAFRRRLMDHLGIAEAEVTTAAELTVDRAASLQQALERATGKQVIMATRVNPSIIGGVVARVNSTVYDGSVARQLERIKAKMIER